MQNLFQTTVRVLSSLRLTVVLLVLLAILTWLGTLEQVDTGLFEVQRRYFDSLFLIHQAGSVPIPLPGARLVMLVLFVNLIVGGIVRIRRSAATAGVLVAHFGIAFLLVAGMVKAWYAVEGHVTLYEGERANTYESYYRWEIALLEDLGDGRVRERVVPEERFASAQAAEAVVLDAPALPFRLEIPRFLENCRVMPKGPMVQAALPVIDGYFLESRPRLTQAEGNEAGAYVALVDRATNARQEAILHGTTREPWTVESGGKRWGIELRHERYPLPFELALQDFEKEDHPRIDMPKAFSSEVTVAEGSTSRPVKISMNEPLRQGGVVVYQSSWGPSGAPPGTPLFSTFAVVSNPADQFPLYACIVIAIGLTLHFSRKLARHIRIEAQRS